MDKSNDKNGPKKSRFPRVRSLHSIAEEQTNGKENEAKISELLEFIAKKKERQLKALEMSLGGNRDQFSNNGNANAAVAAMPERKLELEITVPVLSDEQPVVLPGLWRRLGTVFADLVEKLAKIFADFALKVADDASRHIRSCTILLFTVGVAYLPTLFHLEPTLKLAMDGAAIFLAFWFIVEVIEANTKINLKEKIEEVVNYILPKHK